MTCIVGLFTKEKKVFVGGDSGSFTDEGSVAIMPTGKVFKKNQFVIGCAGAHRFGSIMRYEFAPPEISSALKLEEVDSFMSKEFVASLKACLKATGYLTTDETNGGDLIPRNSGCVVGVQGFGVYYFAEDFGCVRGATVNEESLVSTGSGMKLALGAMLALQNSPPRERIMTALDITARLHNCVRAPFSVLEA